jgi:hybrid cluster-associated redox disulfide protein
MFNLFGNTDKAAAPAVTKITRDTIIGDILDQDESTAPYFFEIGMHCLGCPASRGESIEEACQVHGVDCDALIEKLNAHLGAKA